MEIPPEIQVATTVRVLATLLAILLVILLAIPVLAALPTEVAQALVPRLAERAPALRPEEPTPELPQEVAVQVPMPRQAE